MMNREGHTLLSYALLKEKHHAAKFLLDHVVSSSRLASSADPSTEAQFTTSIGEPSPKSTIKQMTVLDWISYKNQKQSGMMAQHYAAFTGDVQIMRKLVALGVDIHECNFTGMSVL